MFVFDLDGTIALNEHRQHFVDAKLIPEGGKKDWEAFHQACHLDTPNHPLVEVMYCLRRAGHKLAIISARNGKVKQKTLDWLAEHEIPYDYLDMRLEDDHRDDNEIKLEMIKRLEDAFPGDKVAAIFDDRQKVVKMWRENGYVCFQVAPGEF